MMKLQEIRIRDPFVLPRLSEGLYYLYGTTDTDPWFGRGEGFRVWWSENLTDWDGGIFAFVPPGDFWAHEKFWAPEVIHYRDAFYMSATFTADDGSRAVQILKSASPRGPFLPLGGPITPEGWMCLDGTVFVENGQPWMVFCHEWTQIRDGAICAMKLSRDLTGAMEEPITLFHASQAPWTVPGTGSVIVGAGENYVTDGPYLFHGMDGSLKMIWSGYAKAGEDGYAIGVATSLSGSVCGPWRHGPVPLLPGGGHGMIFQTFDGQKKLILHTPNASPIERAALVNIAL